MAQSEPDWVFLKAYLADDQVQDCMASLANAKRVFSRIVATVKACTCNGPHNRVGGALDDDDVRLEHFLGIGNKDGNTVRRLRMESDRTFKELLLHSKSLASCC